MSWVSFASAPAHFVAGLALFALAGIAWSALRPTSLRDRGSWAIAALTMLAMAEWCGLERVTPPVCQFVRLGFEIAALVALVELGRRTEGGSRRGLLPRWSYLLFAAGALPAVLISGIIGPEVLCLVTLVWQATWLAVAHFKQPSQAIEITPAGSLAAKTIAGGLLIYLLATCVGFASLGMLGTLVAATAAYWTLGPAKSASQQSKLVWRCAWPVAFLLIAGGGCAVLAARNAPDTITLASLDVVDSTEGEGNGENADQQDREIDDQTSLELNLDVGQSRPDNSRPLLRQAKRVGMGVVPILLFVFLVWGLSRLPFVH